MIEKVALTILIVNVLAFVALWKKNQNALYAVLSISLLVLFATTIVREFTPEWRGYQKQYIKMQMEKETDPETLKSLAKTSLAIKQIWHKELGIADRCITCHLAVDNPAFKDAPEPFRYHKASREHSFAAIGCTICHSGQGRATESRYAHARDIHHWDKPMWEKDMVQISCPQCHEKIYEPGQTLKGAELLVEARELMSGKNEMEMACTDCHTVRGKGEVLGPELTEFGASTEHEFELTHSMNAVEGERNKMNWTYQHFLDPIKITPGDPEHDVMPTIMPNFEFTEHQAHALTTFVYSLQTSRIPANYQYKGKVDKSQPSFIREYEESVGSIDAMSVGQQIYVKNNCWFCHTVDGDGGKVGPNLSKVGKKLGKAGLVKHFQTVNSKKNHPMANRFKFNESQIDELTDYLATLR